MGHQTIGQWACAALSVLAVLGCAPREEADEGAIAIKQSAVVAALPAFPYDSLPVEIKNVSTGKCLTWLGTGTNGGPAVQRTCDAGAKNQMWFLIKATGTTYQLRPGDKGWRVMGVTGGSTADTTIEVNGDETPGEPTGVSTDHQFGFDSTTTAGVFRLKSFASKCVEVQDADASDSAVIRQTTCTAQNRQRWQLTPRYVNFSFVTAAAMQGAPNEHLCMDVANASPDNGAAVQQWWCTEGAANQRWSLVPSATAGYYSIKSTNSNRCIDVPSASTSPGVQVQQFDCHGGDNQLWSFTVQPSDGRLQIKNKNSGLCLKVGGPSVAVNGAVVQDTCGGTAGLWLYTQVVRRHIELVHVANNDGSNVGVATDAQVAVQLGVVKNIYEQWGVNLLFDPAADRIPTLFSTHMNTRLRSNFPPDVALCWVNSALSASAAECATTWSTVFQPNKVVIFELTDTTSGFARGSQNWIKSMPIAGAAICTPGTPTVYDDLHWGHEFGHYMGLAHMWHDLVDDTPADSGADCVDPRNTSNAVTTNIMTYHYNLAHQISPNQAKIVRQTAFARWY
jgi:hypothetical protein